MSWWSLLYYILRFENEMEMRSEPGENHLFGSSPPQSFLCAPGASTRNTMKHCQSCPKFKLLHQFSSHQITKITYSHIQNKCLGNRSKCFLSHWMVFGRVSKLLMPMLWTILEGIKLTFLLLFFFFSASKCCGQFNTL